MSKFDLDFPGGTPGELVAAIQDALNGAFLAKYPGGADKVPPGHGKTLNAVVPEQYASIRLSPLKAHGVDAAQVFGALLDASQHRENYPDGTAFDVWYGFKTKGTLTDESVWYFSAYLPHSIPQKFCMYFLLTPYLEKGLSVDDITTAVQTGWKLLGGAEAQELRYHPETNLLIVVADNAHFEVVRSALAALDHWKPIKAPPSSTSRDGAKSN